MENNITVFLIDNNEIDNFIHQKTFEKFSDHIKVLTFSSGIDALEYLRKNKVPPQLILLSMHLPMDGSCKFLEYYEKFDIEKKDTRIYILSALISPTDLDLIEKNTNCSGYIEKPLAVGKLLRLMEKKTFGNKNSDLISLRL